MDGSLEPTLKRDRDRGMTARRLTSDSLLFGAAGALGKALALITVPVLSRALGPDDYGMADLAIGFSALATLIVGFAGDMSAARLQGDETSPMGKSRVLSSWIAATAVISCLAALLLLPFADAIAGSVWNAPDEEDLAILSILLIPVAATQAAVASVLRLVERPVAASAVAVIDLVAQVGLAVLFVLMGAGPEGVIAGFIAGSALGLASAAAVALPHLWARPRLGVAGRSIRLGASFLPVGVIFVGADYVVRYLLANLSEASAVGHFAVAIRLASPMLLVSAAFSMAWGPYGLGRQPGPETSRLFGQVLEVFGIGAVLASLLIGAMAPEIVTVVSGSPYLPAGQALPGLVLAAGISGAFFIVVTGAGIHGNTRAIPISAIAGGVVQVVATALLIRDLGLVAVGICALLGRMTSLVILWTVTRSSLSVRVVPLGILAVSVPVASLLSVANAAPSDTLLLRTSIALGVVLTGLLYARLWRPLPLGNEGTA